MTIRPTLRCPCDGAHREARFVYDTAPSGETRFDLGGQDYVRAYDRCATCGHWFGRHAIDLSTLYSADYVTATYGGMQGMADRLARIRALPPDRSDNAGRVARIRDFVEPRVSGRRLMDVGAGLGVFPAAMKDAGWDVTAIEPDPRTVEHLTRVVGVRGLAADLLTLTPQAVGRFELITFNKVLEHVEDPAALAIHAATLLAPGGWLYIELPDGEAASRDPDGKGREEFFIEHHHVFSPASLAMLATRAGLSVARLDTLREPSGKYTLYAFCSILSPA